MDDRSLKQKIIAFGPELPVEKTLDAAALSLELAIHCRRTIICSFAAASLKQGSIIDAKQ